MTAVLPQFLATEEGTAALRHARQALAAMSDCLDPIFDLMNRSDVPTDPSEIAQSMAVVEQMAKLGRANFEADTALIVLLSLATAFGGNE